jgi:2-oxoglutarate dehydrogenase E1 component
MQVVNCSTAANYFHLLRTQMRLPFRKPLIVVAPKKLLRFKSACSNIEDFAEGSKYQPVLGDANP